MARENIQDIYTLSPVQQGMLFHTLLDPESGAYTDQFVLRFAAAADAGAMRDAWRRVVERHSALRTSFLWEDLENPVQVVHRRVNLPWRVEDWSALAPEEAEERLAAFCDDDRRQGFDLTRPPLLRVALVLVDGGFRLVLTCHHLVLDGWSMGVLLREVQVFLGAALRRTGGARIPVTLPPARPFGDYIRWLGRQDLPQAEAYWRRTLGDFATPLSLGIDRAAGGAASRSAAGALGRSRTVFPEVQAEALQAAARRRRVTLHTLVEAAWVLVLERYGGTRDLVYGLTVSGRPASLEGVRSMVGCFINTLPVRAKVDPDQCVGDWLRELQAGHAELRKYEYSPLSQVQRWSGVAAGRPLFETLVISEGFVEDEFESFQRTNYPLALVVVPRKSELRLSVAHDRGRFDETAAGRMKHLLRTLLENALAGGLEGRVRDLPALPPAERFQLLFEWNEPRPDYAGGGTAPGLFSETAAGVRDRVAAVFGGTALTYGEFETRARRFADHLRRRGVRPGDAVGVCLERCLELPVCLLAILEAGGAYLPLDPAYPRERLELMLEDAGTSLVVTGRRPPAALPRGVERVVLGEALSGAGADRGGTESGGPGNAAYVIYTSGSTGRPKGVVVPHRALANRLRYNRAADAGGEPPRHLQAASIGFDTSINQVLRPLTLGGCTVLVPPGEAKDGPRLARLVARERVTHLGLPPLLLAALLEEEDTAGWTALREVASGGEAVPADLPRRLAARLPGAVFDNRYGPTEATVAVTSWRCRPGVWEDVLPIGRPIARTAIYLLDGRLRPVPLGTAGELYAGGPALAQGYLRRPARTATSFVPHPFGRRPGERLYRTGDLARYRGDGALEFAGRIDQQVQVRGFRVELGEIEARLRRHPRVRAAAVVDLPEGSTRRLAAYLVPAGGPGPFDPAEVRGFLAERLPEHMVPAAFVTLDALPLLPSGKVDRRALPEPSWTPAGEVEPAAPGTPTEELLAGVWAAVLGRDAIGVHDDFLELGGHSLLALQVMSRVRKATGVELPLRALFEAPTVAGLAARVDEARRRRDGGPEPPPIAPDRDGSPLPLSFVQERLWFLDRLEPGNPWYNVPAAIRLRGRLRVEVLAAALGEIARRHEVLRTRFVLAGDDPRQEVLPPADLALPRIDLAALPEERRLAAAHRLATAEFRRPFDLARGRLWRPLLLKLDAGEHLALLTLHHIVSDGWSVGVLLRELGACYRAFHDGEAPALPALEIQYADFAAWQRRWLAGEVLETRLEYWRRQLEGAPRTSSLATDRPRPPVQTYRGALRFRKLPEGPGRRLARFGRERGATLFMTLFAVWSALLSRLTGARDLLVGTPVANRDLLETEDLIGPFVNTLVLRADLGEDPSFEELTATVRECALGAYAHQDVPFERLVDELQPRRDLSRSPLFQVMLIVQKPAAGDLELPGLTLAPVAFAGSETAKFDLTLTLVEDDPSWTARMEYNRDLFDATTVDRVLERFERLLAAAVEDPRRPLGSLPLLGAGERHQLAVEWSGPPALKPAAETLHHLVEAQAARTPEAPAVLWRGEVLTYRELDRRAEDLAGPLRSLTAPDDAGPGRETLVGLCLDRGPEMVVAMLAVLKSGGAYVPLDPAYPKARLRFLLEDTGAPAVVTAERHRRLFDGHAVAVLCVDPRTATGYLDGCQTPLHGHLDGCQTPPRASPLDGCQTPPRAGRLAYVIYTSGSTGRPKGVAIEHRSTVARMGWARRAFSPAELGGVLASTSINFDLSAFEIFAPLCWGGTAVLAENVLELPDLPDRARVRLVNTVPSALSELLGHGGSGVLPEGVLTVGLAGEPLRRALVDELYRPAGVGRVLNLYGPSEDTTYSTAAEVPAGGGGPAPEPSVGRPIPGTRAHVLDRGGRRVPLGAVGELHLAGSGLARGYLARPALTAERFVPDGFGGEPGGRLYRTGDLARWRSDGELLFLGRADHQVKVRGFRIELGEIEAALAGHPAVARAAVVPREDDGDLRLAAFVVPRPAAPSPDELRAWLRERLPEPLVPSRFVLLETLPATPNGKVDRRTLARRTLPSGSPDESRGRAPESEVERAVAGVWEAVLGVDRVGLDDNFFDLGGHSLLMVRVHARLRERLDPDLTVIDLFRYPTVRALAVAIEGRRRPAEAGTRPRQRGVRPPAPGSPADVAIVGLAGRFPGAADVEALWRNLRDGRDAVVFSTDEELAAAGLEKAIGDPDFVRAKLVLEGFDRFDAPFFDYSRREAELIDPQQRVFLECAWEALEDAGHDAGRYPGRIGVFGGVGMNYYQYNIASRPEILETLGRFQAFISNDKDFLPTRVSYKLDLDGPSVNVQTACSTSLVAVCLACESLLAGRSDMALAGGVTVNAPRPGYRREPGGIASPDGHTRTFDARAGGTVPGSGAGVVVLKRLEDAVADGDSIRAVIKGFALNNDGSLKVGFTAPSVEGQAAVIAEAQAMAGVDPRSITYVEAHGTATPLGDPIEIAALTEAFRAGTADRGFCAVGSIKTNLGHTDAAAGVAGLIKTALALGHRAIPPSLHFEEPNPEIDFAASPFYVNTELRPWADEGGPRRAGVSSFGIGGTNAHVIVEEAPPAAAAAPARDWQLLTLSARTPTALDALGRRLADAFESRSDLDLADAAYTLQVGRKVFPYRRILAAETLADAAAELRRGDGERVVSTHAEDGGRPVVFLFPGGGTQYAGMGRDLYRAEAVYREEVDRCAELLAPHLDFDVRDVLFPPGERLDATRELLRRTSYALPALFVTEYALARLWTSWGVRPGAMIGHSLGEYVAACLAGVLSLADALAIVALRGRLFEELPRGAMLGVALPAEELGERLGGGLSIAALNTPGLSVVSGATAAIDGLASELEGAGVEVSRLHIDVAAHSALVEEILAPFAEAVADFELHPPRIPYLSNVTGTWITDEEATDPGYWPRHLRGTVRFADGLGELFGEPGRLLVEVGPGQTLSTLARQHPEATAGGVVPSLRRPREPGSDVRFLTHALGRLWLLGAEIDWHGYHRGARRRRRPLPTYPFERRRYWIEARDGAFARSPAPEPPVLPEGPPETAPDPAGGAFDGRVAPRNATEEMLASLWRELLGAERIGVHDDFFELGGSSLLAVRLGSQLRRRLGRELEPQFLLEAPTIARLAALLDETGGGASQNGGEHSGGRDLPPCLVELRPGRPGRRPLFLVHPVGGHVYFYRDLAERLGDDQPVFGIQARGLDGEEEPFDRLPAMAAHYVEAVRRVEPRGPYRLAGSSMGGMIAFEMAQQLHGRGEAVDLLAMLDTAGPGHMPVRPEDDAEILAYLVRDRLPVSLDELRSLDPDAQLARVLEEAGKIGALPLDLESARRVLHVVRTHLRAMFSYEIREYPGHILFFRARERREWDPAHPERAWIDVPRQGIEVRVVPGDHLTMHHPGRVEVLAETLRARLVGGDGPAGNAGPESAAHPAVRVAAGAANGGELPEIADG